MNRNTLLEFLRKQKQPVSIADIIKKGPDPKAERREVCRFLQEMKGDNDVFRSLVDGKAYYSALPNQGEGRVGWQRSTLGFIAALNPEAAKAEQLRNMRQMADMLRDMAGQETSREDGDMPVLEMNWHYDSGEMLDINGALFPIPDGLSVVEGDEKKVIVEKKYADDYDEAPVRITINPDANQAADEFTFIHHTAAEDALLDSVLLNMEDTSSGSLLGCSRREKFYTDTTYGFVWLPGLNVGSDGYQVKPLFGKRLVSCIIWVRQDLKKDDDKVWEIVMDYARRIRPAHPPTLNSLNTPKLVDAAAKGKLTDVKKLIERMHETVLIHYNFRFKLLQKKAGTISDAKMRKEVQELLDAHRDLVDEFAADANGLLEQVIAKETDTATVKKLLKELQKLADCFNDRINVDNVPVKTTSGPALKQLKGAGKELEKLAEAAEYGVDVKDLAKHKRYLKAVGDMEDAETPKEYEDAADAFAKLKGYQDSAKLEETCRTRQQELLEAERIRKAQAAEEKRKADLAEAAKYGVDVKDLARHKRYLAVKEKMESAREPADFTKAAEAFSKLKGYLDSDQLAESSAAKAKALTEARLAAEKAELMRKKYIGKQKEKIAELQEELETKENLMQYLSEKPSFGIIEGLTLFFLLAGVFLLALSPALDFVMGIVVGVFELLAGLFLWKIGPYWPPTIVSDRKKLAKLAKEKTELQVSLDEAKQKLAELERHP